MPYILNSLLMTYPYACRFEQKVRYIYLGASRGEESTIATTINDNQREYDVELNIPP